MVIFNEVVFPKVVKEQSTLTKYITPAKGRLIFECLYCNIKQDWISMVECIECPTATRTLEELMDDFIGCDDGSYCNTGLA